MKNLATILLITILFSCTKEKVSQPQPVSATGQPSRGYSYFISKGWDMYDTAQRFESTFDIKGLSGSGQLSVWCLCNAVTDYGEVPIQTGYQQPMNYVLMTPNGSPVTPLVLSPFPILSTGRGTFGFYINSDGYLVATYNGKDMALYPMKCKALASFQVAVECSGSRPSNVSTINFYPAFTLDGKQPSHAVSQCDVGSYGVEGMNQNKALRFNEIQIGTKVKSSFQQTLF